MDSIVNKFLQSGYTMNTFFVGIKNYSNYGPHIYIRNR